MMSGWWGHYDFRCQLVDYSRSPMAMRVRIFYVVNAGIDHRYTLRKQKNKKKYKIKSAKSTQTCFYHTSLYLFGFQSYEHNIGNVHIVIGMYLNRTINIISQEEHCALPNVMKIIRRVNIASF